MLQEPPVVSPQGAHCFSGLAAPHPAFPAAGLRPCRGSAGRPWGAGPPVSSEPPSTSSQRPMGNHEGRGCWGRLAPPSTPGPAPTGLLSQERCRHALKLSSSSVTYLEGWLSSRCTRTLRPYTCPESCFGACPWWARPRDSRGPPALGPLLRPRRLLTPLGVSLALPVAGLHTSCAWPPAKLSQHPRDLELPGPPRGQHGVPPLRPWGPAVCSPNPPSARGPGSAGPARPPVAATSALPPPCCPVAVALPHRLLGGWRCWPRGSPWLGGGRSQACL